MTLLEIWFLLCSTSIDSLFAGISYGMEKIKLALHTILLTSMVGTLLLAIAIVGGKLFSYWLNPHFCSLISNMVLIALGIYKIGESIKKKLLQKKKITWKVGKFNLIFSIYQDPPKADLDLSKKLSVKEAIFLTIALSLDNLAIGLGLGLVAIPFWKTVLLSFFTNMIMLASGYHAGKYLSQKIPFDLSWISGIILIMFAFI